MRQDLGEYFAGWSALALLLEQGKSWSGNERNTAYLNLGNSGFCDVSAVTGLDFADDGRAVAFVDWDHDGDLDVWMRNRTGPRLRFMRNGSDELPGKHGFVAFKLRGTTTNAQAIGARVELVSGEGRGAERRLQTLTAGDAFLSQSSKWVHFGIGGEEGPFEAVVRWPGGGTERFSGILPDERYELVEGSDRATRWSAPGRPPATASRKADPVPSKPASPGPEAAYLARVPLPSLSYLGFDDEERAVTAADAQATLVLFWASWCAPCVAELRELAAHEAELRRAGLEVVALTVDGIDPGYETTPKDAQRLLERYSFPFTTGIATTELLTKIELIQSYFYTRVPPLGVPVSFLLDDEGNLVASYRGAVDPPTLIADVGSSGTLSAEEWLARCAPFPGRWLDGYVPFNPTPLAEVFGERFPEDARRYLRIAIEQGRQLLEDSSGRSAADAALLRQNVALTLSRLAGMEYAGGQRAEAAMALSEALEIWPDFARAHMNLALLLRDEGEVDQAIRHLREALRIEPQSDDARRGLASALRQRGVKIGARRLAKQLRQLGASLGLDPDEPADRRRFRRMVTEFAPSAETIVSGSFRRQGEADFFVKGREVLVAREGRFVTILKDGIDDPDVRRALRF